MLAAILGLKAIAFAQGESEPQERNGRRLVVSIPHRKLAVIENGQVIRLYETAVGAKRSPSPVGAFIIANRISNPTYYAPGRITPPGKSNPLGTRWLGLNVKGYGIHGTNVPSSIGKAASHGCIRMRNKDVEELFELVSVGDQVELHGELDEDLAALFGRFETPAAAVSAPASDKTRHSPGVVLALAVGR